MIWDPRQWEGTVQYGLDRGNKFGIMCSTDQHSGYPGSYGDGRIGVLAPSLTRDAIWDALKTVMYVVRPVTKLRLTSALMMHSWETWYVATAVASMLT